MPSFEEAKVWGILATQNAQVLLDSARLVAEHGDRGRGISLAVLAVEEAAKARAMFGYARSEHRPGFILDAATMRKIIRGPHQVRHLIAWLQGSSREARQLSMSETRDPEAEKRHEAGLAALDWLLLANRSKNGGLYVDYLGSGHWSTPQAATEEQWAMADFVAGPFVAEAGTQAARWLADLVAGSEQLKSGPPDFPADQPPK
jgi:AbiV family abortive infection protein